MIIGRCASLASRLVLIHMLFMQILKEFPSLRDNGLILSYAAKAIAVSVPSVPREPRISVSGSRLKQKTRSSGSSKLNFTQSIGNLHKEARRAFSWTPRDAGSKTGPKEAYRKRKSSGLVPSERVAWDAMAGIQEEHVALYSADGQERLPLVPIVEEWVLTGDRNKDNAVRTSHRYETSPDITLFKVCLLTS